MGAAAWEPGNESKRASADEWEVGVGDKGHRIPGTCPGPSSGSATQQRPAVWTESPSCLHHQQHPLLGCSASPVRAAGRCGGSPGPEHLRSPGPASLAGGTSPPGRGQGATAPRFLCRGRWPGAGSPLGPCSAGCTHAQAAWRPWGRRQETPHPGRQLDSQGLLPEALLFGLPGAYSQVPTLGPRRGWERSAPHNHGQLLPC